MIEEAAPKYLLQEPSKIFLEKAFGKTVRHYVSVGELLNTRPGVTTSVPTLVLPLPNYVTSDRLLNLSVPELLHGLVILCRFAPY